MTVRTVRTRSAGVVPVERRQPRARAATASGTRGRRAAREIRALYPLCAATPCGMAEVDCRPSRSSADRARGAARRAATTFRPRIARRGRRLRRRGAVHAVARSTRHASTASVRGTQRLSRALVVERPALGARVHLPGRRRLQARLRGGLRRLVDGTERRRAPSRPTRWRRLRDARAQWERQAALDELLVECAGAGLNPYGAAARATPARARCRHRAAGAWRRRSPSRPTAGCRQRCSRIASAADVADASAIASAPRWPPSCSSGRASAAPDAAAPPAHWSQPAGARRRRRRRWSSRCA